MSGGDWAKVAAFVAALFAVSLISPEAAMALGIFSIAVIAQRSGLLKKLGGTA